jgi:hypothetical protein
MVQVHIPHFFVNIPKFWVLKVLGTVVPYLPKKLI